MDELQGKLALSEWRRAVASLYAAVREAPEAGRELAWHEWRARRNDLFKYHEQSPLDGEQRAAFRGLAYYAYDARWRIVARMEADPGGSQHHYQLGEDGDLVIRRLGWASFELLGQEARLALYWVTGYGGGLFLPFRDATNGRESYGGGRYLYDTIKGADLGAGIDQLLLDFNYSYNPSCAYHSRWVCPLAPAENRLAFAVQAGEQRLGGASIQVGASQG